ncbi:uncharacterized protein LOC131023447 [Salvia miltiorrhiza]|uniref:uncharacterized protein LOC131023447 n=1 Tax=Salvia miltiorrhiza TaxID=226208 RepID=UPI0025AB85B0|nr:uncharacterized protein LOC131023447 [Salvia miltiorrhiza]
MDEMERMLNSFWWGNKGGASRGINWMKWERFCVDKKLGGLGFRSLQLLNMVTLGKMGWRLIDEPDALMCKVLKVKYFPTSDFLSARIGHSLSFTWRSILTAQDLVRREVRWQIGDGTKVRIFHDPWLRRDEDFRLALVSPTFMNNLLVHDLMIPGTRRWDVDFLQVIVDDVDLREIDLQVGECAICRGGFENLCHSFFHCPFADECWRVSNLQDFIESIIDRCDSFKQALFKIVDEKNGELKASICMLLWQIWRDRNIVVWKNVYSAPHRSVCLAADCRNDWILAREARAQHAPIPQSTSLCLGWLPISSSSIICGVDAALFASDNFMGLGLVIRNHDGGFVVEKTLKTPGTT